MSIDHPSSSVLGAAAEGSDSCPLFVDLDGTLINTDSLHEAALIDFRRAPLSALLRWLEFLRQGRAGLKAALAEATPLDTALLPYNKDLVEYLRDEHQRGRKIHLATAADWRVATAVADHLGFFESVLASDGEVNLKGERKLQAIRQLADGHFAYAGNSAADLPIWAAASRIIVVNAAPTIERRMVATGRVEKVVPRPPDEMRNLLKAMRPHQWVKNLLVFVPLLTAFRFADIGALSSALFAFIAFCLCASATYVVNDLFDLQSDRAHPRKCRRPFASGQVTILQGILLALTLLVAGLVVAIAHSLMLFAVVASYTVMTTAYSLHLKRFLLLDTLILASLYTWRLLAGILTTGLEASVWLLAFALFVFLSLALLKRCAELVMNESSGEQSSRGRDYRVADLRILWPLGVAVGVCSIVIFVLFANSPEVRSRYHSPQILWLAALALAYWLGRMWLKTGRGEMTDDPIVYALKNRGSRITLIVVVALVMAAHFVQLE